LLVENEAGFALEFLHFVSSASPAYNHPQRERAAPPESGGELRELPSSDEGRRVSGGGGAGQEMHHLKSEPMPRCAPRRIAAHLGKTQYRGPSA
jgi:hypothetical protein